MKHKHTWKIINKQVTIGCGAAVRDWHNPHSYPANCCVYCGNANCGQVAFKALFKCSGCDFETDTLPTPKGGNV